jgi:hypothetical protein
MKKVLAWAVALALVLSSFTMAFAADAPNSSQFKDASSINYTEAVDVMVAQGIINGYPDGTFGPAKTVKRSEMAKMIAVMMNGGEDIGDQYKSACPFADSKDHWAAGYIAYCASEHIIDGRSADVFDPEAEVTGTEVAKMALTSLGYDSKIQGYTGENWAAAVLKDAKKNKLFNGLMDSFVPGDPCNRESAAQILFNCLQANMVEYDTNTSISIGDTSVEVSTKAKPVMDGEGPDAKPVPLYKEVFDGDLVKTAEPTAEGKPAHKWANNKGKDKIGIYPDTADETAVVDEAGKKAEDIVKDVDEKAVVGKVTINGFEIKDAAEAKNFAVLVGDQVEMFEQTNADGVYDLVIMRYQLAKIGEVDTDVTAKDAKEDVTAYVYINNEKFKDTEVVNFDADSYVEDTYLAVAFKYTAKETPSRTAMLDSYVADKDQGTIEKKAKSAITVNGTASDMHGNYTAGVNAATKSVGWDELKAKDTTYDVYFDSEGYVLGAVIVAETNDVNIGLLDGVKSDTDAYDSSKTTYTARILDEKAEPTEYAATSSVGAQINDYAKNGPALIKYELNDNNKIKKFVTIDTAASQNPADKDFGEWTTEQTVSKRGTVGNKILSEDVVAYYYSEGKTDADGEVTEEAEWITYGYKDLLDNKVKASTEKPATYVLNSDGEIAYILLGIDLVDETETTVLGYYVSAEDYDLGEGTQYDITLLVKGAEETITTAPKATVTDVTRYLTADATQPILFKLVLNGDGQAKEVTTAYLDDTATVPKDDFGKDASEKAYDGLEFVNDGKITTVSGKNLLFEAGDYTYVGDATVLRIKVDADGKYAGMTKFTGDFAQNGMAKVLQLDKKSEVWDTVVYITENDYAAWTNRPADF